MIQEFYRGLELLCLHTWKLSSDLFKRQAFLCRLQMLLHWNLGGLWHAFIMVSGPCSFIGVVGGTVLYAKPRFSSQSNSLYTSGRS